MVNKKKIIISLISIFAVIILLLGVLALSANALYKNVTRVVNTKNALVDAMATKDTAKITLALGDMRQAVLVVANDFEIIRNLSFLPGVKKEAEAIQQLLIKTNYLLDSAELGVKIVEEVGIDLQNNQIDFTCAENLKKIDMALVQNKTRIANLAEQGNFIIQNKLAISRIAQINDLQKKINPYVVAIEQIERLIVSSEDGLATFLGLRGEKKYLLLFENSQELRPGGGLISTYGLITLKEGQTTELFVDHVQNLSDLFSIPLEANPEPIQKMRHQKNLFIYDANWSGNPAEWLEKIYRSWNAQKPLVDGVIVVNTKMLEDLVKRFEPVQLPNFNQQFRASDIVASLDYYFEVQQKTSDTSKYKILGPLVDQLIKDVKSSKLAELKEILLNTKKRFQSRDIFVYSGDASVVDLLKNNHLQNNLPVPTGDEFCALTANIGSGKADAQMQRSLKLNIFAQDEKPFAMATITHDYSTGKNDFRSEGYYGYLRFFLPLGSNLGAFDGFDLVSDEKIMEAGRQVFSNYFSIATGTNKDVAITYTLSKNVVTDIENGKYSLTLRKQGGVEMPYEVNISLPKDWQNPRVIIADGTAKWVKAKNLVVWKGQLTKDVTIDIQK